MKASRIRRHQRGPTGISRPRTGLARALSKLGFCSRSEAWALIEAGHVRVNDVTERDPERRVDSGQDRIEVDGAAVRAEARVYLMLNKPRGLITSASDEKGRATVFECLRQSEAAVGQGISAHRTPVLRGTAETFPGSAGAPRSGLPRVFPVGRLDKASEGLLLFTNDTAWASRITDPASHLDKTYHLQIDCLSDETLVRRLTTGILAGGDFLSVKCAKMLRLGEKNSWLEAVLDEGKNRHLRRLLEALRVRVLRLVRVAIGPLHLGALAKGDWRHLTREEVAALAGTVGNRACRPGLSHTHHAQ